MSASQTNICATERVTVRQKHMKGRRSASFCRVPTKAAGNWQRLNISRVSQDGIQRRRRKRLRASGKVDMSRRDTSNTLISCLGPWILFTSNIYSTSFFSRALSSESSTGHWRNTTQRKREAGKMRKYVCCQVKTFEMNQKEKQSRGPTPLRFRAWRKRKKKKQLVSRNSKKEEARTCKSEVNNLKMPQARDENLQ